MLYTLGSEAPRTVGDHYFVAPTAVVIGRVTLGRDANVWFGAVLRGDVNTIDIGDNTNVQENAVVHVDSDAPAVIGANVTIGHAAVVHGCTVGEHSLIGIGAIVLNGARIGAGAMIGAGALIPEGKVIPPNSVVFGTPGKVAREVTEEDRKRVDDGVADYMARWKRYAATFKPQT